MGSRIFTFGCSFTEYVWPTWSDIILYGNEGYNMGIRGTGIESTLFRLLEVDRKYKLTDKDKVIIIFTTPIRWDLIISENLEWCNFGQATTSTLSKYENELYTIDGLIFKSIYQTKQIKDFLDKKSVKYVLGSVNGIYKNYGNYFESLNLNNSTHRLIRDIECEVNLDLQDFHSFLYEGNQWTITKKWEDINDYHPRPMQYFKWVTDVLLKHIDVDLKITKDDIMEIESHIDRLKKMDQCESFFNSQYVDLMNKKITRGIYL